MKLRPRIKLLTLLLVMTIVALAVTLWQNSREVIPLRNTVRALKKELGQFHVDNPSLVHVQRRKTITGSCWRWELFLPNSSLHQLYVAEGSFGEILPGDLKDWLKTTRPQSRPLGILKPGHFSFRFQLKNMEVIGGFAMLPRIKLVALCNSSLGKIGIQSYQIILNPVMQGLNA